MDEAITEPDPAQHWEARYADADAGKVWSGRPNQTFVDVVGGLPVGRAVDLGCGEGGDAIWLASQGWQVTGVDISPTAISRADAGATAAGIAAGRIRWIVHDLVSWTGDDGYDLVSASFLHSWFDFPRTDILRRAAGMVAPGGHLLIVSHAEPPPWADLPDEHGHDHDHFFPSPADEIHELDLPESDWEVLIAETRSRDATGPDGQRAVLLDGVVLLRRR